MQIEDKTSATPPRKYVYSCNTKTATGAESVLQVDGAARTKNGKKKKKKKVDGDARRGESQHDGASE